MEYKISFGKYSATVLSKGAELVSFTDGEKEYIWTGDEKYWSGHNPNLFPLIGRLKNGKVLFGGKDYFPGKHGFARSMEFSPVSRTESELTLAITQTEETRAVYPFDFVFEVTHRVFEGGFETVYTVKNTGGTVLYYTVGGHPGINLPALGADCVEGCRLVFEQAECPTIWYGDENVLIRDDYVRTDILRNTDTLLLTQKMFEGDALMMGGLKSNKVRLVSPTGAAVEMDYSGYPVMAFWTPPGKTAPFMCLEPWHGLPANAFESGEFSERAFCISLDPGAAKSLAYSVKVL